MADIHVPDETIEADVKLIGLDSSAGAIMGAVARGLREKGNSKEVLDSYYSQAMAGDYNHLLRVSMAFTGGFPFDDADTAPEET